MYKGVPVACRTRSKGVLIGGGLTMDRKRRRRRVVDDDDDDDEVIFVKESKGKGKGASAKMESVSGGSFSSPGAMERGFEFLGETEDDSVEVVEIDDDDEAEEEFGGCDKRRVEVKEEGKGEEGERCSVAAIKVESFGDDECGARPDDPVVLMRDSDGDERSSTDDGYGMLSSSTEWEDDETSDDDFKVDGEDDDGVESEYSSSEGDSDDSSYDDERGAYKKMVKERVRNLVSETESSGVSRGRGKRKESMQVEEEEEEEKWNGADCASVTSSKSDICTDETKIAQEKRAAKRVESVNAVDAELFVSVTSSKSDFCKEEIKKEAEKHAAKRVESVNAVDAELFVGVTSSKSNFCKEEAKKAEEKHEAKRVESVNAADAEICVDQGPSWPLAAREAVPLNRNCKKKELVEPESEEINMLWNELDMLLQETETGDSTMVKKQGKNNANTSASYCVNLKEHKGKEYHHDKGSGVRSGSTLPKRQEKMGDSAKVVIKEDDETGDKDGLHEVLRMSSTSKNKGFKFFTECFWGKPDSVEDDPNELEEKDGDVYQGQTKPLACREGIPLQLDFMKKKPIEKSESEKELDILWAEMEMLLRAEEIGCQVDNIGTNEARENEGNPASQCKHDTIFSEEIGRYCRWCGRIDTEIKYIAPPFLDFERSGRRVSSSGGNTSKFNGAMFNESGDDSEAVWSHNGGTVWDLIPDIKQNLYPHLQEGFEFIWENLARTTDLAKIKRVNPHSEGGCIISHAPGTGKTRLTMVFLQTYLQLFPKCLPVIIAPANILLTWEDELRKWKIGIPFYNLNNAEFSGKEHAINEFGNQEQNKDAVRMLKLCSWYREKSILLISYNLYEKLAGGKSEGDREKEKKNRKVGKEKKHARTRECIETAMGKVLRDYPGLLVLDEGHTPRNQRSCIWKVLSESRSQKRILLSGTPFHNNFLELFNILCLMKPSFPDSIPQELKKFCQSKLIQERNTSKDVSWESISSGNPADEKINQLKLLMNPFVHVHKGSILQKNLPGLRHCVLVLKPEILQQNVLESIECSQNALNFEHKLALVSVHPSLFLNCSLSEKEESVVDMDQLNKLRLDPYGGVKTKVLKEFVRLCDAFNEKVLVFSQFIDTLCLIKDQLEAAFNWSEGTEVLYMHGRLDQKQKQSLIHSFNDANTQAKVLLASIKASSEGINLIGASRVVLLDVVWNPSVERQAICRAYRLGQKKVVFTYHLLAQGTPECTKYCKQAEKNRLSELVFSNRNAENDMLSGVMFDDIEDRVLDLMVQHEKLKDMFGECLVQPKERDLETLGP